MSNCLVYTVLNFYPCVLHKPFITGNISESTGNNTATIKLYNWTRRKRKELQEVYHRFERQITI